MVVANVQREQPEAAAAGELCPFVGTRSAFCSLRMVPLIGPKLDWVQGEVASLAQAVRSGTISSVATRSTASVTSL